jgi:hypothetical protein
MIAVWKMISVLTRISVRFRALARVEVEAVLDGVEEMVVEAVLVGDVSRVVLTLVLGSVDVDGAVILRIT